MKNILTLFIIIRDPYVLSLYFLLNLDASGYGQQQQQGYGGGGGYGGY